MYLYNAINRINEIEWTKLGIPMDNSKQYLGYEYLRRMAGFIKEYEMKPMNPLFINISDVLGERTEKNYVEYCSVEVQEVLKDKCIPQNMVNFYLQLSDYVDRNKNMARFLQIYEPMIQLLEQGYNYEFREAGLMVYNVGFYPLRGWYERFLEATPKGM